ncbi:MAG: OmpA family protein [Rhodospirillaceae bacterium]|nr:OmpA family protein [Rhodospirillaceae bacterium]
MNSLRHVALAAAAAALAACAPPPMTHENVSAGSAAVAAMPVRAAPSPVSDFDRMRAALPTFALQRSGGADHGDVSVVRDVNFPADSSILSRSEVMRLEPLRSYLRANPSIEVRIEGYGDSRSAADRNVALSLDRAQAVSRALLTDVMVENTIVTVGAVMPQATARSGSVEVMFVAPAKLQSN